MINEMDSVVLKRDLKEHSLKEGDVGAVVHRYPERSAYEVEFVTAEGETVALLTLTESDVRPMQGMDLLQVREYAPA